MAQGIVGGAVGQQQCGTLVHRHARRHVDALVDVQHQTLRQAAKERAAQHGITEIESLHPRADGVHMSRDLTTRRKGAWWFELVKVV